MIKKATEILGSIGNVCIIQSDLTDADSGKMQIKFDIIFSNAVLHWILDHHKVFKNFYNLLNPKGELLIQCGGFGNLKKTISVFDTVKDSSGIQTIFFSMETVMEFCKPS